MAGSHVQADRSDIHDSDGTQAAHVDVRRTTPGRQGGGSSRRGRPGGPARPIGITPIPGSGTSASGASRIRAGAESSEGQGAPETGSATEPRSRIRRGSAGVISRVPIESSSSARHAGRVVLREALKGRGGPDQPPRPERDVVEADDDDFDELDDEDADSELDAESNAQAESSKHEDTPAPSTTGLRGKVRFGVARSTSSRSKYEVRPTGAPRVNNNAGGSTCTPDSLDINDLTWNVVDAGKKGWGVQVAGLDTSGQIDVNPTPNNPTSTATPNTSNPVDGGNITKDNWQFAIQEMREYHQKNGGRGAWHDTAASSAHEWAHWDTDWMKVSLGRRWPAYRRKMERLAVSKTSNPTQAAARTALLPKVTSKLDALDQKATKKWNKIPDEPGAAGATGYKAGQKVLNARIKAVRSYATSKGWTLLGKIKQKLTGGNP